MTMLTTQRRGGAPPVPGGLRRSAVRFTAAGATFALAAAGLALPAHAAVDETYDVQIRVAGKGGTVDGAGTFEPGETVDLTALPKKGHVWGGWTSDELEWIGARVDSFTMPEHDVVLEASFRKAIKPLERVYKDYFDIGNIWSHPGTYAEGSPNLATIDRHYSVMTAENHMKPDQLLPNDNIDPETGEFTFSFEAADQFVNETLARGMDVHGHVLVWHGQSPPRINSGTTGGTRELARANMERYIATVLTHFQDRAVSWDVVNEAFVDGLEEFDPETQDWREYLRGGPNGGFSNWYNAYANGADVEAGEHAADFLYDAFLLARTYGPETRLEYNDFNVFQSEGKAQAIIAMALDLNERYAAEHPEDPRPLVEAIGLQSHNYINQTPAFACSDNTRLPRLVNDDAEEWQPGACSDEASVERSLQLITEAGFTAAVSELDVQVWEAWNAQPEGDNRAEYRDLTDPSVKDRFYRDEFDYWVGKIDNRAELEAIQAQRYAEYFAVYKKYSQDLHRITFWGLTDQLNWRSTHNPQIFNGDFSEKLSAPAVANPEKWLGLRKTITDTSRLEAAIAQANELDLRGSVYEGRTLAEVKKALGRANGVLKKGAKQSEVNKATQAVLDAVDGLKPKDKRGGPKKPGPKKPGPKKPGGPKS